MMKAIMEELWEKRLDQARESYATFTDSTNTSLAAKRERLQAFAEERLWRAAQMKTLEMGQAQAVHDMAVKDTVETCEKAVTECKEKALNECTEEIRKLEDKDDRRSIPLKKTTESGNAMINGDDEDSDAAVNNTSIATSRPRRNNLQQTMATTSSTMVSTNLNTMLTEAEIWDDLQLVFPEEVNKAGYMKRQAKMGMGSVDMRVEGSVGWYQGQRFIKGDRIKVKCVDLSANPTEYVYTGHVSGVSNGEITMKPSTLDGRELDESERSRIRMALGQIRAGRFILQHDPL
jgi:hypothetical protein